MAAGDLHDVAASDNGKGPLERYEELILQKSALQKECFHLEREYLRVFGEDIMALFRIQLECAAKKKTIEFCQIAVNRGLEPDPEELSRYIAAETAALRKHFKELRNAYENSGNAGKVTQAELTEIRRIYRRLAKLIHPDLHPEYEEKLSDIWNRIVIAYKCNDLEQLKELEVIAAAVLADMGCREVDIVVPDIGNKIAKLENEIAGIMDRDPYQYKFLLSDKEAVKEKKASLRAELENYTLYRDSLDDLLRDVLPEGMIVIWDTEPDE